MSKPCHKLEMGPSLLHVETKRINKKFDARWTTWQEEQGWISFFTYQDLGLGFDHLPLSLYEYFPDIPLSAMRSVALASRAASMYAFLLQKEETSPWSVAQVQAAYRWLQTFAREQLSQVIPTHLPFWERFSTEYRRCQEAFEQERELLSFSAKPCSPARFLEIMDGKMALAGLTASALACLCDQEKLLGVLRESQRYLYAGLQLYHDVLSWKQDFVAGVSSYVVVNLLMEAKSFTLAKNQAGRQEQISEIGSYYYYAGVAERMLSISSEYLCRAIAAVTDLPPNTWGATLAGLLERNEALRRDLVEIRQRKIEKLRSARAARSLVPPTQAIEPVSRADADGAITAAASYLAQEQAGDGRWGDFLLLAEQSTFWVTGYVGWTLARTRPECADLPQAARWLLDNQFSDGGWGYNSHWPEDADSIANALLFLAGQVEVKRTEWEPALRVLLTHQRADGGFTTIVDAEAWLARFRSQADTLCGWTASHPCVTAVVALLFATLDDASSRALAARAVDYLQSCQRTEGYWDAYWWVGKLYTTCRAVQAMRAMDESPNESCLTQAEAWLMTNQNSDGGWSASDGEGSQPFHTALAVQALCALDADNGEDETVIHGIRWLLDQQLPDGSWPAAPILCVPSPNTLRPWERRAWRESILGLDVVVSDWHRLFATATALQALTVWAEGRALA